MKLTSELLAILLFDITIYFHFSSVELSTGPQNEKFLLETIAKFLFLRGPTEHGFQEVLVESYTATVDIAVYQRGYFGYHQIDSKSFKGAALEFGGDKLCEQNPCTTAE